MPMQLVLPEYGIHVSVTIMLLVCGFWFTFLFNTPLLAYHIWRLGICEREECAFCTEMCTLHVKLMHIFDTTLR